MANDDTISKHYVLTSSNTHEFLSNDSLGCHICVTVVKAQWSQNHSYAHIKIFGGNCHQPICVIDCLLVSQPCGGRRTMSQSPNSGCLCAPSQAGCLCFSLRFDMYVKR